MRITVNYLHGSVHIKNEVIIMLVKRYIGSVCLGFDNCYLDDLAIKLNLGNIDLGLLGNYMQYMFIELQISGN